MKWFDIPVLMRHPARPQRAKKSLLAESLEPRTLLSADGLVAVPALTSADDELVGTLPATAGYQAAEATAMDIGGNPQQTISSFVGWAHAPEDDGQIRVQKANGGEVQEFEFNAQTQVLDAQGAAMEIDELEGLKVRVTYVTDGPHQVAEIIQVCRIQVSAGSPRTQQGVGDGRPASSSGNQEATQTDSFVGTVTDIDEDDNTIRVQKGDGGNLQTFHYDKNTQVLGADGDPVKIDELEDVKVRVTYHTKGVRQVADKIEILRHQVPNLADRTLQAAGDGFATSGAGGGESPLENATRAAWFTAQRAPRDARVADALFGGGSGRWRF